MSDSCIRAIVLIGSLCVGPRATAAYTWTFDRDGWFAETGNVTSIGFGEVGEPPVAVTDQFAELGWTVLPSSTLVTSSNGLFTDGIGASNFDPDRDVTSDFAKPINTIGLEILGGVSASFYRSEELIETTAFFGPGGPSEVGFVGFTTDFLFDRVVLRDIDSTVAIDNFHFPTIPGPPGVALLVVAAGRSGRRRRPVSP